MATCVDLDNAPCREPSAATSSASATASCGPSTPRLAADREPAVVAQVDGDAVDAEQLGDPVDRPCRGCARATGERWPRRSTASRARLRSSSRPASRARSDERRACAARTAKLASWSRPARPAPGRERSEAAARRAPAGRAAAVTISPIRRSPWTATVRVLVDDRPRGARHPGSSGSTGRARPSIASSPSRRRQTTCALGPRRGGGQAGDARRRTLVVGDGGERVTRDDRAAPRVSAASRRRPRTSAWRARRDRPRARRRCVASRSKGAPPRDELEHAGVARRLRRVDRHALGLAVEAARGRAPWRPRSSPARAPRAPPRGRRRSPGPRERRGVPVAIGQPDGRELRARCRARPRRRARRGSDRATRRRRASGPPARALRAPPRRRRDSRWPRVLIRARRAARPRARS